MLIDSYNDEYLRLHSNRPQLNII